MRPTHGRLAARKDGNDGRLATYARSLGWELIHQPPGAGCDWIALLPDGRVLIVEIKNPDVAPSQRKLTAQELQLFEACVARGISYHLVENERQIDRINNP